MRCRNAFLVLIAIGEFAPPAVQRGGGALMIGAAN